MFGIGLQLRLGGGQRGLSLAQVQVVLRLERAVIRILRLQPVGLQQRDQRLVRAMPFVEHAGERVMREGKVRCQVDGLLRLVLGVVKLLLMAEGQGEQRLHAGVVGGLAEGLAKLHLGECVAALIKNQETALHLGRT
ncbi:MAG: hypothetical protein IPM17_03645 [Verrucomicrobia bacterium]|jgi:hypothetical protein|nr:hypothetical protein [Verrucomicrobiota bacterium]